MKEYKISIIVPVYNAEKYLEKCLDSLIGQTYGNVEIICVNDGSGDGSLGILREFARKDARIRVVDQENAGVSQARNRALKEASGDYIMFVDADDWVDADTCEKVVRSAVADRADIVMWSYCSETDNRSSRKEIFQGKQIFTEAEVKTQLHRRFVGVVNEELARPELADALCPVWGKLYRRELTAGVEFTDLRVIGTYEDGLFNLAVFGKAAKVVYLPAYFYHYRRSTTQSVTSGYRDELSAQWQNLFQRMDRYIEENQLPQIYRDALRNRIALSIQGLGLNIVAAEKSWIWKTKKISELISRPEYREAYQKLDFQYFPIHWKVFYGCARFRCAVGVYALLKVISRIISR